MVEGDNSGDLSCFQMETSITQVGLPSSIMHREMMELQTRTGIWKATDEGNRGCCDVSIGKCLDGVPWVSFGVENPSFDVNFGKNM